MVGRYPHAHQFKRANRELKFLRTRLARLIRDINRKISGDPALAERFAPLRALAVKVRFQNQRQRGPKVYSLHAPEVECIGKGKARAPYEFGCKVSIAVPVTKPKGGQFVLHAKALHGNPFDGHTLKGAVADVERNTGVEVRRTHVDKGYRGHHYPNRFRVYQPPGPADHRRQQTRDEAPRRRRAGDRSRQGRSSNEPQRPQRPRRRPYQCRPRRRRFQLPPPPEVAGGALARHFPAALQSLVSPHPA